MSVFLRESKLPLIFCFLTICLVGEVLKAQTRGLVLPSTSPQSLNSEGVRSNLFISNDGVLLSLDSEVTGCRLIGIVDPEFGQVEVNELGELVYIPAVQNGDLIDEFYLVTDDPKAGVGMLVGAYNPADGQLSFTSAVPSNNEIVIIVNNGGPEFRKFSLDGNSPSDVLEVIRRFTEGGINPETEEWEQPVILGGIIRLDGVTTFFGDPRIIFSVVTPEVAAELGERNNKDLGFLFGPLGSDLSTEERSLLFDLMIVAVDLGGILDPTPVCDGVACAGELSQGNFVYAGINVVSMIPWLGDLAKAGKASRLVKIVKEAIEYAAKTPKFAARIKPLLETLSNALGRLPNRVTRLFGDLKTRIDDFLETLAPKGVSQVLESSASSWKRHGARLYGDLKNKFGIDLPFKAKDPNIRKLVGQEYQKLIDNGTLNYRGFLNDRHGAFHFYEHGGNLYLFGKDGSLISRWAPGSQGRAIERVLEQLGGK